MHLHAIARPAAALLMSAALGMLPLAISAGTVKRASLHASTPLSPYDRAQRMREALNGRAQDQRTRRDYDKVLDAYRAIYHSDPSSLKADASVSAVADLLAEEGRVFEDEKSLHDAIGQYEFLRREYPASRLCPNALLTQAAIFQRDLGDSNEAKARYKEFLKQYPHNALADQARAGLKDIHKQEVAEKHGAAPGKSKTIVVDDEPPAAPPTKSAGKPSSNPPSAKTATSSFPGPQTPPAKVKPSPAPQQAATAVAFANQTASASTPKSRHGKPPLVTNIRHWSTNVYTRVAIDLDDEVQYEAARVPNPDRIFFDLHGTRLSPELIGRSVEVTDDGYLRRIRAAQFSNDVTRIVLDVSDVSDYSAFLLPNPYRLIIDIHGRKPGSPPVFTTDNANTSRPSQPGTSAPAVTAGSPNTLPTTESKQSHAASTPSSASSSSASTTRQPQPKPGGSAPKTAAAQSTTKPATAPKATEDTFAQDDETTPSKSSSLAEVRSLGSQKDRVKATARPTTAPISASVAGTRPAPQEAESITPPQTPAKASAHKRTSSAAATNSATDTYSAANVTHEAAPTSHGERSLVRALGLKIGRIVVDAGHGGHDSGTLGPDGIEEKEVVLDVSLRLGKLLKQRLGADVIFTRDDDTFIPLETRTAIANKAQADLFISVHANSSQDSSARGVETYYLNFTASPDALEVAARENAVSNQSIHQLSDLVKKITLKDKIDESREFAGDVQDSLFAGLEDGNRGLKDRGVKKAPFVVLIGANMPSILAEISFLTNPDDARELRDPNYRQRIAESLYKGVAKYIGGLSGVRLAQGAPRTAGD
jgi:N-acetylmuramoyl-L-alanine amidase